MADNEKNMPRDASNHLGKSGGRIRSLPPGRKKLEAPADMKNQLPAKGAKKDSSKPAEPKRGGRKPKRGAKKLGGISSLGDNPNLLRGADRRRDFGIGAGLRLVARLVQPRQDG